jgi:hypothetical protein
MKRPTLLLGFALLITSVSATPPWSGHWGADSTRNHVSITYVGSYSALPVIDGIGDEAIWKNIPPIPIERNWKNRPYYPTLYSSNFKAFWTDTTICILVQNKDDSFWPSWKAGLADYLSDKVELYFGVNGIGTNDGAGGAQLGQRAGLYQVTQNYQRHANMGKDTTGNLRYTHEASTYIYSANGDTVYETVEWVVNFKALRNSLTTDSAELDPTVTPQILFDITISDLDSATDQAQRYRQGWSGMGWPDESWANMDSAGVLTFENCIDCPDPGDHTHPTAVITSTAHDSVTGDFRIKITFSELVWNFTPSDLSIINGYARPGTFETNSNIDFSVVIAPIEHGNVTIDIDSNVCEDDNSNGNLQSEPFIIKYVPVAVENYTAGIFDVYPNPVEGFLNYNITGYYGNTELSIFTTIGTEIYHTRITDAKGTIDLHSIKSGAYILKLQNGRDVILKKIVVK